VFLVKKFSSQILAHLKTSYPSAENVNETPGAKSTVSLTIQARGQLLLTDGQTLRTELH